MFRVTYRGRNLKVSVGHQEATYVLTEGLPMEVTHHGTVVKVTDEPMSLPIPPHKKRERPAQPPGRAPTRRGSLRA